MKRGRKRRDSHSPSREGTPGYRPGALSWLTRELEVPGSTVFPVTVRPPLPVCVSPSPPLVTLELSGEGAWCE